MNELQQILDELRKPFHPSHIVWKPGAVKGDRALAMAYADLRAYMNRLDEVCGYEWTVEYEPWGLDRIICRLTIGGVTRSSTGEMSAQEAKGDIGGTTAEAQSFKRASAMFGLGRYLYNLPSGWYDFDPKAGQFTAQAKAKLTGILAQHYRQATEPTSAQVQASTPTPQKAATPQKSTSEGDVLFSLRAEILDQFNALGEDLYGAQWEQVRRRNVSRISGGQTQDYGELTTEQIEKLVDGMLKLRSQRQAEQVPA